MEKTEGTGQRVGGYRVVRRLATGGTSDVLLAKAEGPHGFERSVVLKLLLPEYRHDADVKGMFAREAAAYARLSHPSIVRLYDFFANDDQLVMVLEYIDGPPLSRLRGMLKAVDQQLDDTTALYVSASIFDALAAAHGAVDDSGEPAPVIHRDVNPSNVLIPWDGQVKLADFGVAKVTGASHQSNVGLIRGTFGYMAPEQVKGETVTPRADVYAGAIILWELLTKRRAFIRGALPEIEVLRELAEPRIVSIDVIRPDLDRSVREAIKRALQPRGDKRTITAEEMASILRAVVPENEGRERLAKALALVRHEPKPSLTSIPPPVTDAHGEPDTDRVEPRAAMMTKPGLAPRVTPPPRPAMTSLARKTSPFGSTLPSPTATAPSPRPPVVAPPRPGPKRSEPPTLTAQAPPSERGLAALLEPSESDRRPHPGSAGSEPARLAPPLAGVAQERDLKDAIDDILSYVPSKVPPNLFPKTDPPGGIAGSSATGVNVLDDPFGREIGHLPAAPPPLEPWGPLDLGATLADLVDEPVAKAPSSFPPLDRTLALEHAPRRPFERHAQKVAQQAATLPMRAAHALPRPPTVPMVGFGQAQGQGGGSPLAPSPGSSPPATLPFGSSSSVAPAPFAPSQPSLPVPGSYPPAHAPPSAGTGSAQIASGPYALLAPPSAPPAPAKRRSSGVAITAVLLVAVVAGGVGTAAYVRRQKARAMPAPASSSIARVPAVATPAFSPGGSASAPTTPAATASMVASASAPAATPPAPPVLASASASAPSVASASTPSSASASAPDLPPGTGRVRTTGAAAGRRIFVDEKVAGQTPDAVVVKCGVRSIKLGSSGSTRSVDVPCGGEITVGDR